MTIAICFSCGKIKFGGYLPCPSCKLEPKQEDELVYSLVLTDHYFDRATLEQISQAMQSGHPRPSLPADQYEQVLETIRKREARETSAKLKPIILIVSIIAAIVGAWFLFVHR